MARKIVLSNKIKHGKRILQGEKNKKLIYIHSEKHKFSLFLYFRSSSSSHQKRISREPPFQHNSELSPYKIKLVIVRDHIFTQSDKNDKRKSPNEVET